MQPGLTTTAALRLHIAPLVDMAWIYGFAALGMVLFLVSLHFARRTAAWRAAVLLLFLLFLLNPALQEEERKPVRDTAFIVVDQSASQTMGERTARTTRALTSLKSQIEKTNALDVKIVDAAAGTAGETQTRLFDALETAALDVPQNQRAGVILLTDGQVHDAPPPESLAKSFGPIHTLLSGEKSEQDRQIVITKAPAYGLVGKDVTIEYRVEDTNTLPRGEVEVTLTLHDGSTMGMMVPPNTPQTLILNLDHPGQNVFALEAAPLPGELTRANNKTAILINGVRDRLKVLLVSGVPHTGERPWRDLLTSDPGVDLIHFTILRDPDKFDFTPQDELSLIAFPVEELFEEKLYDFDLIIFDHYRQNNILPDYYFDNIVQYVKRGGAFLEASGPSFAGDTSIYTTPLRDILPGAPTGRVLTQGFRPEITPLGFRHPVTAGLVWNNRTLSPGAEPDWGHWLRQIDITRKRGDVLMSGVANKPLLILDRVEKGRIAQISSDHVWLWARNYDGGGPHAELLRRVVHWLMHEPELDERALEVTVREKTITITKQALELESESIAVTDPEGDVTTLELTPMADGPAQATMEAPRNGLYAFEDTSGARKYAIVGPLNPPELRGVKTTAAVLEPITRASGGTLLWLQDTPEPIVRMVAEGARAAGKTWLGLRVNQTYSVTGVRASPILPDWVKLALLFVGLGLLWWREGRSQ